MIKWIKRILLSLLLLPVLLILLVCLIKPQLYYRLSLVYATQIQWFGQEESGNEIIESSLSHLNKLSGDTYHMVSVQNTKNGNYDQAIDYLEKAIALNPEEGEGYYGWVLLHYYRDYERALQHLLNYDAYTPDFTDNVGDDNILYAIGLCYKGMGKYDKALEYIDAAMQDELTHHSEDWIPHHMFFQKGRVLHIMGRLEEAIVFYDKTLKIWEKASEVFFYKGLAQIAQEKQDEGCENLNKSLALLERGYKTTDSYVEVFDEVYKGQVLAEIQKLCKQDE